MVRRCVVIVNKIIDAVVSKLKEDFGYEVYTDNIEQGMEKPCFFVFNLNPNQERKLLNRHKQSHLITIQYFPGDEREPNIECNSVISKLFEIMEYLELDDGPLQSFEIKCEIVDDVLFCFAEYIVFTNKVEEKDKMADSKLKSEVTNGD